MSVQQHAAIVILESIHVLTVNTAGIRSITRDATLGNVSSQGHAVQYSMTGAFDTLAGWVNAIFELDSTPFDDNVAHKVVVEFTAFVQAYSGLMLALIEKHGVLTSARSPLGPDGAIIGEEIAYLQFGIAVFGSWLTGYVPTRVVELAAQEKLAMEAFEKAAAKYPKPNGGEGVKTGARPIKAAGTLRFPEPPK
ncbi:hypothetical protein C2E23DRAFT_503902 [Lenzites betulinus]|nr:hypothetical protein C2E23DRAFT_503902 [Lenzites betulinus]